MIKNNYTIEDANSKNIVCIAMDFLDYNLSLRKFAEEHCNFSYVTLRDKLLNLLPTYSEDMALEVKEKLSGRKPKSIQEDEVAQARVLRAINMLLEHNMTIEEIANTENTTIMVIYRDLTSRLQKMDKVDIEIKKAVLLRLQAHSLENLINQGSSRK